MVVGYLTGYDSSLLSLSREPRDVHDKEGDVVEDLD